MTWRTLPPQRVKCWISIHFMYLHCLCVPDKPANKSQLFRGAPVLKENTSSPSHRSQYQNNKNKRGWLILGRSNTHVWRDLWRGTWCYRSDNDSDENRGDVKEGKECTQKNELRLRRMEKKMSVTMRIKMEKTARTAWVCERELTDTPLQIPK